MIDGIKKFFIGTDDSSSQDDSNVVRKNYEIEKSITHERPEPDNLPPTGRHIPTPINSD